MKAKREGSRGPLYQTLFETAHGTVKIVPQREYRHPEREQLIVGFKFPRRYGLELTKKLYEEESDQVMSYFKHATEAAPGPGETPVRAWRDARQALTGCSPGPDGMLTRP